ncbi:MAG: O-antigen polymerase [bacterium]
MNKKQKTIFSSLFLMGYIFFITQPLLVQAAVSADQLVNVPYYSDVDKENALISLAEKQYLGGTSSSRSKDALGATQLYSTTSQLASRVESEILRISKSKNGKQKDEIDTLLKSIYNDAYISPDKTDPSKTAPAVVDSVKGVVNSIEEVLDSWTVPKGETDTSVLNRLRDVYGFYLTDAKANTLIYTSSTPETIQFPNLDQIKDRIKKLQAYTEKDIAPLTSAPNDQTNTLLPEFTLLGRNLQVMLTSQRSPITGKASVDWPDIDQKAASVNLLDIASDYKNLAATRYTVVLQKYLVKKQAQSNLATKLHKEVSDIAGTVSASPYDMDTISATLDAKYSTIQQLVSAPADLKESGFDGWVSPSAGIEPMKIDWDKAGVDAKIVAMKTDVTNYLDIYRQFPNLSNPQTQDAWKKARASVIATRDELLKVLNQVQTIASSRISEVSSKIDDLNNSIKSAKETVTGLNTIWNDMNATLVSLVSWVMGIFSRSLNIGIEQISKNTYLKEIHGLTRDLANMFFILFLVVAGLATAFEFNPREYSIQKLFPRFIQAVVLVNFSLLICQIVTDLSLILSNVILEKAGDIGNIGSAIATTGTNVYGISGAAPALLFGDILTSPQASVLGGVFDNPLASVIIMLFIFLITMAVDVFLIIRAAAIWFLVALSPAVFLMWFLPNFSNMARVWWRNFLKAVFLGPVVALVFLIGVSFSQISLADNFLKIIIGLATFGLILFLPSMTGVATEGFQKIGDSFSPLLKSYLPLLSNIVMASSQSRSDSSSGVSRSGSETSEEKQMQSQSQFLQLKQTPAIDLRKLWQDNQNKVASRLQELQGIASNETADEQRRGVSDGVALPVSLEHVGLSSENGKTGRQISSSNSGTIITALPNIDSAKVAATEKMLLQDSSVQLSANSVQAVSSLGMPELSAVYRGASSQVRDKLLLSLDSKDGNNVPLWTSKGQEQMISLAARDYIESIPSISSSEVKPRSLDHYHTPAEFTSAVAQNPPLSKEAIADVVLSQTPLKAVPLATLEQAYANGTDDTKDFLLSTLGSGIQDKVWSSEQVSLLTRLAGQERIEQAKQNISTQAEPVQTQPIAPSPKLQTTTVQPSLTSSGGNFSQNGLEATISMVSPALLGRRAQEQSLLHSLGQQVFSSLPLTSLSSGDLIGSLGNPDVSGISNMRDFALSLDRKNQENLFHLVGSNDVSGSRLLSNSQEEQLVSFLGEQYYQSLSNPVLPPLAPELKSSLQTLTPVSMSNAELGQMYSSADNLQNRDMLLFLSETSLTTPDTKNEVGRLLDKEMQDRARMLSKEIMDLPDDPKQSPLTAESLQELIENKQPISTDQLGQTFKAGIPMKSLPMADLQGLYESSSPQERDLLLGSSKIPGVWTQTQKDFITSLASEDEKKNALNTTQEYLDAMDKEKALPVLTSSTDGLKSLQRDLQNPLMSSSTMTALASDSGMQSLQTALKNPELQEETKKILSGIADKIDKSSTTDPVNKPLHDFANKVADSFGKDLQALPNKDVVVRMQNYAKQPFDSLSEPKLTATADITMPSITVKPPSVTVEPKMEGTPPQGESKDQSKEQNLVNAKQQRQQPAVARVVQPLPSSPQSGNGTLQSKDASKMGIVGESDGGKIHTDVSEYRKSAEFANASVESTAAYARGSSSAAGNKTLSPVPKPAFPLSPPPVPRNGMQEPQIVSPNSKVPNT